MNLDTIFSNIYNYLTVTIWIFSLNSLNKYHIFVFTRLITLRKGLINSIRMELIFTYMVLTETLSTPINFRTATIIIVNAVSRYSKVPKRKAVRDKNKMSYKVIERSRFNMKWCLAYKNNFIKRPEMYFLSILSPFNNIKRMHIYWFNGRI